VLEELGDPLLDLDLLALQRPQMQRAPAAEEDATGHRREQQQRRDV
jgi:hypothetical protein